MNQIKIKRKGIQGWGSVYYKTWNKFHPGDLIKKGDGFVIHHKDGNPNNNDISNLEKMLDKDHKKYHSYKYRHPNWGKKFSIDLRKKLSDSHKGQKAWNKDLKGIWDKDSLESNRKKAIERHKEGKYKNLYSIKYKCPYCGMEYIISLYKRWHGDKCKRRGL